jgi:hypothetical protein
VQDAVVVRAAAEGDAAVFDHTQPAPLGAIGLVDQLQRQHRVRHAAHLQVGAERGAVVEQDGGAGTFGQILLERQHLAPVAQRALGQQLQLGQRIEHHAARLVFVDRRQDALGGVAQFDLGRVEDGVLLVRIERRFHRERFPRCGCRPCSSRATAPRCAARPRFPPA